MLQRSAIKSSGSSSPTESRTRLSFTPPALLLSAGMVLWVISAEWLIRLLMPPRLSASLNSFVLVTKRLAASRVSSFKVKDTMPPKPRDCFLAMA